MMKGSVCVPVPKKSEELRSVGFTKRSYNVRRWHEQEGANRQMRIKKKLTTKRNSRDKPKPEEVKEKEKLINAGSKEESLARPSWEGNSREKPNPDEVNKIVVDSKCKKESFTQLDEEGNRREMLVTREMVDLIVGVESVDYMLGVPLQFEHPDIDPEFAEFDFDFGVSDTVMADAEENAYVLRQYRTNKHTEFPTNQEVNLRVLGDKPKPDEVKEKVFDAGSKE